MPPVAVWHARQNSSAASAPRRSRVSADRRGLAQRPRVQRDRGGARGHLRPQPTPRLVRIRWAPGEQHRDRQPLDALREDRPGSAASPGRPTGSRRPARAAGARSARLTTSQYRLWSASKPASAVALAARRARTGAPRDRRRPRTDRCPGSVADRTGSSSWRTTPNANGCSSSDPFASSAVMPAVLGRRARLTHQLGLADPGRPLDQEQRPVAGARPANPSRQRRKLALALEQSCPRLRRHPSDDTRAPRPAAKAAGKPSGILPCAAAATRQDRPARGRASASSTSRRCGCSSRRC